MPRYRFTCRFISPFHTSQRDYGNLATCAPFVLGSTLRGAVLGQAIQRTCQRFNDLMTAEVPADFHARCEGPCGLRELFLPTTRFSFGQFPPDAPPPGVRTRVGMDRESWKAADGALLYAEVMLEGKSGDGDGGLFTFTIDAPEGAAKALPELVAWAGEAGVGRFRNLGYGRFVVEKAAVEEWQPPAAADLTTWTLRTPYVLRGEREDKSHVTLLPVEASVKQDLVQALGEEWQHLVELELVEYLGISYVYRWVFDRPLKEEHRLSGRRDCRAVLPAGTGIRLKLAPEADAQALAPVWRDGLGEWRECGFGEWEPVGVETRCCPCRRCRSSR